MCRHAANLSQKRSFICCVKNNTTVTFTDRVFFQFSENETSWVVSSARPSVYGLTSWPLHWPWFFPCTRAMTLTRRKLKVKVIDQDQGSLQKYVCYTNIYYSVLWELTGSRSGRFPQQRHQLRTNAARRAAWRSRGQPAEAAESRACGRVNLVGLT